MTDHCLELVVFKIKDPEEARKARRAAQDLVCQYDGFLSWTAYEAQEDETLLADVVLWKDLASAKAASEKVLKDPVFAALLAQIDGIVSLSHYGPDRRVTARAAAA